MLRITRARSRRLVRGQIRRPRDVKEQLFRIILAVAKVDRQHFARFHDHVPGQRQVFH